MTEKTEGTALRADWDYEPGNPNGTPDRTTECSFLLRPDSFGGIGIFAAHDIMKGVKLRLYDESASHIVSVIAARDSVPGEFIRYCMDNGDGTVSRPANFSRMDLVWFLNHSPTPNAIHDADYAYFAARDITAGDEITIDYDLL